MRCLSQESVAHTFLEDILHSCPPPLLAKWRHLLLLRRHRQALFTFPTTSDMSTSTCKLLPALSPLARKEPPLPIDQTPSTIAPPGRGRRRKTYPILTPMLRSKQLPSSGSVTPLQTSSPPTRGLLFSRQRFSPTSVSYIPSHQPRPALILRRRTCVVSPKSSRPSCPTFLLRPGVPTAAGPRPGSTRPGPARADNARDRTGPTMPMPLSRKFPVRPRQLGSMAPPSSVFLSTPSFRIPSISTTTS